jgi:DNA helicase-2/ATP-dependent DNA helicase PcrA
MNEEICCTLNLAGPGAGKTHNMVNMITEHILSLRPNKFLAVITYTNEATKVIKSRLERHLKISQNVFIGTIHSFLIQFIISPYAHLYKLLPLDKCYVDEAKLQYKPKNQFAQKYAEIKVAEDLANAGFITFDKILEKSYELVERDTVCRALSNRLQYVFIDEYQDSRVYQHLIFKKLIEIGKTKIFVIGDPHQSIFNFTYIHSQLKSEPQPEGYEDMPINDLKKISLNSKKVCYDIIEYNHRSRPNIVNFVNNFNVEFAQEPVKEDTGVPVMFINEPDKQKLIEKFFEIKKYYAVSVEKDVKIQDLFLSRTWDTFDDVATEFGLKKISNDGTTSQVRMSEIMRCIYGITGLNRKLLLNTSSVDDVRLRKLGFRVLKEIDKNGYTGEEAVNLIVNMFKDEFGKQLPIKQRRDINFDNTIVKLRHLSCENNNGGGYYSTIHSAKGLEATSVLMLANTTDMLQKWLETDKDKLRTRDDSYRLGYVGYSRARELLCIGCLKKTPKSIETVLRSLKVEII